MKKVLIFSLCIITLVLLVLPIQAHSGRTDSDGGHYNRSTNEYHYHHGYPAHDHPNGVCPYLQPAKEDDTSNILPVVIVIVIIIAIVMYWLFK